MSRIAGILVAAFMIAGVGRAAADPVVVQSGDYTVSEDAPYWALHGSGFDLAGLVPPEGPFPGGSLGPYATCYPCAAGSTVNMSSTVTGALGLGSTATFNGVSYSNVSYQGTFNFTAAPITAPSLETFQRWPVAEPFSFTGQLSAFGSGGGPALFSTTLTGTGTAELVFDTSSRQSDIYVLPGLAYTFSSAASPTPEPATWLLLAVGGFLALGAARFRLAC